jgi:hypothetical protein
LEGNVKLKNLSDSDRRAIKSAAQEIAYDLISANDGRPVKKAEVIECVLDADRFLGRLKESTEFKLSTPLQEFYADFYGTDAYKETEKFLKKEVFTYASYA